MPGSVGGSSGCTRFKDRNPPVKLPKLDIVGDHQLLGAFLCRLLVGAVKIGRTYDMAVLIEKVSSVMWHPHAPQW